MSIRKEEEKRIIEAGKEDKKFREKVPDMGKEENLKIKLGWVMN